MRLQISDDATTDFDVEFLVDTEVLGEIAATLGEALPELDQLSGEDLFAELGGGDPCGDITSGFGQYDVTVESVERGALKGVSCSAQDIPIAEFTNLGDDSPSSITQTPEGTSVSVTFAGVDEATGQADDLESLGIPGLSTEELFKITFAVSAPGGVVTHNGTRLDGSTVIWNITPDAPFVSGGDAVMTAEWSTAAGSGGSVGGSNRVMIIVIVAAAVLAGVAALVLLSRRRGRQANGADTVPAAPADPVTPVVPAAPASPMGPGAMPPPAAPGAATPSADPGTPLPPPPPPNI